MGKQYSGFRITGHSFGMSAKKALTLAIPDFRLPVKMLLLFCREVPGL